MSIKGLMLFFAFIVYSCKPIISTDIVYSKQIDPKIHNTNCEEPISNAQKYYISEQGKEFIKKVESCSLKSYKDGRFYSIGYGHNAPHVTENMVISKKMAEKYFEEDIKAAEKSLNRLLQDFDYNFPQGFVDGMGSLIYNCGETGIKKSDFYEKLKNCRIKNGEINNNDIMFTLAFVLQKNANTHHKRRREEYNMMVQDFRSN